MSPQAERVDLTPHLLDVLFDVIDDCDNALASIPNDRRGFRRGVELIRQRAVDGLARQQIEPFAAVDDAFDPALHAALGVEPSARPDGTIIRVLGLGWRSSERVVRPARVIVSQGDPEPVLHPFSPEVPAAEERRFK